MLAWLRKSKDCDNSVGYVVVHPSTNVDNRLGVLGWVDRTVRGMVDLVTGIDFVFALAIIVCGIGALGYISASWLEHLLIERSYFAAFMLASLSLTIIVASIARIPMVLVAVVMGATICGVAFLVGAGNVLLP